MNVTAQALELPPWEHVFPGEPYDDDAECVAGAQRESALRQRACVTELE